MDSICTFRSYINKYHPEIASKDWLVNVEVLNRGDFAIKELKKLIPNGMEKVRCLVFFYIGRDKNVVYLIQDIRGARNIAINLAKDDVLVHSLKLNK